MTASLNNAQSAMVEAWIPFKLYCASHRNSEAKKILVKDNDWTGVSCLLFLSQCYLIVLFVNNKTNGSQEVYNVSNTKLRWDHNTAQNLKKLNKRLKTFFFNNHFSAHQFTMLKGRKPDQNSHKALQKGTDQRKKEWLKMNQDEC